MQIGDPYYSIIRNICKMYAYMEQIQSCPLLAKIDIIMPSVPDTLNYEKRLSIESFAITLLANLLINNFRLDKLTIQRVSNLYDITFEYLS